MPEKKFRFEILKGRHNEDGTLYGKGDIIQSDERLDLRIKNKFRLLNPPAEAKADTPAPAAGKKAGGRTKKPAVAETPTE